MTMKITAALASASLSLVPLTAQAHAHAHAADHHDLIGTNLNPITSSTRRDEPLDEITGYSARDLHRRVATELAEIGY